MVHNLQGHTWCHWVQENVANLRVGARAYKVAPHSSNILPSGSHARSENILTKGNVVCVRIDTMTSTWVLHFSASTYMSVPTICTNVTNHVCTYVRTTPESRVKSNGGSGLVE